MYIIKYVLITIFYKLKSNYPFFSIDIQINYGKEIVEQQQIKKYNVNIDGMCK